MLSRKVGEDFALLMTSALVLVLAHTYSAFMAERAVEEKPLTAVAKRLVVVENSTKPDTTNPNPAYDVWLKVEEEQPSPTAA